MNGMLAPKSIVVETADLISHGGRQNLGSRHGERLQDVSGVGTVGMQLKDLTGTREIRQVQEELVGSDEPTTRGRPEDLAEVRLVDSTLRAGEPATWGSGQRELDRSRET